jgi:hypothetical protein
MVGVIHAALSWPAFCADPWGFTLIPNLGVHRSILHLLLSLQLKAWKKTSKDVTPGADLPASPEPMNMAFLNTSETPVPWFPGLPFGASRSDSLGQRNDSMMKALSD